MPITLPASRSYLLIHKPAYERANLQRSAIDARFNLTDDEFRVEAGLVVLGPLPSEDMVPEMIAEFEAAGLVYFDDFFELTGNWPEWLTLYAGARAE